MGAMNRVEVLVGGDGQALDADHQDAVLSLGLIGEGAQLGAVVDRISVDLAEGNTNGLQLVETSLKWIDAAGSMTNESSASA